MTSWIMADKEIRSYAIIQLHNAVLRTAVSISVWLISYAVGKSTSIIRKILRIWPSRCLSFTGRRGYGLWSSAVNPCSFGDTDQERCVTPENTVLQNSKYTATPTHFSKPGVHRSLATKFCTVLYHICGLSVFNLLLCHRSDACKFSVASRLLENLFTPAVNKKLKKKANMLQRKCLLMH